MLRACAAAALALAGDLRDVPRDGVDLRLRQQTAERRHAATPLVATTFGTPSPVVAPRETGGRGDRARARFQSVEISTGLGVERIGGRPAPDRCCPADWLVTGEVRFEHAFAARQRRQLPLK